MHVYIIHGYGANPSDHWFPWLQARLQAAGIPTTIPPLPDSEHPDFAAWQATLTQTIGTPDRNTLLIAHSLGTISLLHYLSTTRPAAVGGLVLVAGFGARLPELPIIGGFDIGTYIDHARLDDVVLRRYGRKCTTSSATTITLLLPLTAMPLPHGSAERCMHCRDMVIS